MEKDFKRLLGTRVYLEMPKKEKSKIVVDENTKEALQRELAKKMSKLTVYAVGTGVTDPELVEGTSVLVDPEALARRAFIIPLSEDKEVMLISYYDIVHIWE